MEEVKCGKELRELYEVTKDLDIELLLAGLTILAKDAADYINAAALEGEQIELFRRAFLQMMNEDRYYWSALGGHLYESLKDVGMPHGMTKAASVCRFQVMVELKDAKINQEWTRAPGWKFFKIFSAMLKSLILDGMTLDKFKTLLCEPLEDKDPIDYDLELIARLGKPKPHGSCFWYPLMLYMVILLKLTDFITLAEEV